MAGFKWLKGDDKSVPLSECEVIAIRFNDKNRIIDASPAAQPLEDIWKNQTLNIENLINKARSTGTIWDERVKPLGTAQTFWLVAMPEMSGDILLVARDMTVQDKVTEALLASRNMFRDMLSDAVDFAWEVDLNGQFTYVGPNNVLGVLGNSLQGYVAQDFFWDDGKAPARNPFKMDEVFETNPVRINLGAKTYWVRFAGKPIFDQESGEKIGVRGVGMDMTSEMEKANEQKQNALRLSLLTQITSVIHNAKGSNELLSNSADTMAQVFRASQCWIVLENLRGIQIVSSEWDDEQEKDLTLDRDDFFVAMANSEENFVKPNELELLDEKLLVVRLAEFNVESKSTGMLVLRRDTNIFPWSRQEKALLESVSDSLAVGIEQANLIDKLQHLSYRDELTGLMNRRAFDDEIKNRLKNQLRHGAAGTLMYVDIDYFKEINDTLGHEAGDNALKLISGVLHDSLRVSDCVGRIGGDEFLVWIEAANSDVAIKRAQAMLDKMPNVRLALGDENLKLSLSVGIVESVVDSDLSLQTLMKAADRAMYGVKDAGKSGYKVVELLSDDA